MATTMAAPTRTAMPIFRRRPAGRVAAVVGSGVAGAGPLRRPGSTAGALAVRGLVAVGIASPDELIGWSVLRWWRACVQPADDPFGVDQTPTRTAAQGR